MEDYGDMFPMEGRWVRRRIQRKVVARLDRHLVKADCLRMRRSVHRDFVMRELGVVDWLGGCALVMMLLRLELQVGLNSRPAYGVYIVQYL